MIVAITVWNDRISPVCDSATTLLLVETFKSEIVRKQYVSFPKDSPAEQLQTLKNFSVNTLLCGAITERLTSVIEQSGIQIVSFITGDFEVILNSFLADKRRLDTYSMPGVRRCQGNGMRRNRHKGRGNRLCKSV